MLVQGRRLALKGLARRKMASTVVRRQNNLIPKSRDEEMMQMRNLDRESVDMRSFGYKGNLVQ